MENTTNNYGTEATNTHYYSGDNLRKNKWDNKVLLGILVMLIGLAILLEVLFPWIIPSWLFSWMTLLIAGGLLIGVRKDFRGNMWWIMVLIGAFFLIDDVLYSIDFMRPVLFPLIIIIIGALIITRSRRNKFKNWSPPPPVNPPAYPTSYDASAPSTDVHDQPLLPPASATSQEQSTGGTNSQQQQYTTDFNQDYVQVNSFFGSNKRVVNSKNFKGGNITCMIGSAELDLVNADFNGIVYLDVFTAIGSLEIAVPSSWAVRNEVVSILGGIEDKRRYLHQENPHKTLVIKGTVLLGGVEIKSY